MSQNQKLALVAVLALLLGFLLGNVVFTPQTTEPPPPGRGEGGMPPSSAAQNTPMGQWPKVDCSGQQADQILDEIWTMANQAMSAGTIPPPTYSELMGRLYDCATMSLSPEMHAGACGNLQSSRQNAASGNWEASVQDVPMGE